MNHRLFAYGTLQLPEITKKVAGVQFETQAAVLHGFRCGLVERADFPGIVPCRESQVQGLLLSGLCPDHLVKLDLYEGELYQRVRVAVETDPNTDERDVRRVDCWVYCIVPWARQRVSKTPWTAENYRSRNPKRRLTYRQ